MEKSIRAYPQPVSNKSSSEAQGLPDMALMEQRADEAARLLKLLGNAHRLQIMCLLVNGEMTVGQINERLGSLSQSALSQHLARLRESDLVSTRRDAQSIWYGLAAGPSQRIMQALYDIYCSIEE
ncbi:MAG TPA: metalloregulator ArsR/SmtB family transcription factor [Woeseiaceae bacterium]|nr:metalloregulator ArsR/SmtB family transcription factor [Woeseiaceae bacterium]